MKRRSFVLAGYFGFGNAGDEMISRRVREAAPSLDWNVLGVDRSRWNPFSLSLLFLRSKALVYGGGELFQRRTSRRSLLYYAALPLLAKIGGARFFAYGMGLDPELTGWALSLAVATLNRADRLWFRDEESLNLFKGAGGVSPASVSPDPVWAWSAPPAAAPRSASRLLCIPRGRGFRSMAPPLLFLHPGADEKSLRGAGPAEHWDRPEDLFPLLSRHDAVASMRYHGLVLAGLSGRAAVAVCSGGKVEILARLLGCPIVPPEAPESALRRAAEDAFARRGEVESRVRSLREGARRGLESLGEVLKDL